MDSVKEFVDFNADVITSLLVVFRPLVKGHHDEKSEDRRR